MKAQAARSPGSWARRLAVAGAVSLLGGCRSKEPPERDFRHVVLIVFDTLRADTLAQVDTPNFDRLGRDGARVERAWSAGTWTLPSMASMFMGATVPEHGWNFPFPSKMENRTESYALLPDRPLLAEVLKGAGFRTVGLYVNRILGHDLGYERGFDVWEKTREARAVARFSAEVGGWTERDRDFLYLHLRGGHEPLEVSDEGRQAWGISSRVFNRRGQLWLDRARQGSTGAKDSYRRAYQAVAEAQDVRLGALLEVLEPHADHTLLVVTADHGELLGEHDQWGHGGTVYEPLTWVPLYVRGAGPLPPALSTAALPDLITRTVGVAHDWPVQVAHPLPLVAVREDELALSPDGRRKGIWGPDLADPLRAFDLLADPGESAPREDWEDELDAARAQWEARTPSTTLEARSGPMSDEMMESLEALGYMSE